MLITCLILYSVVSVSLPSALSVGEGDGRVEVCATLSGAAVATERDFMITLATSNGTALGKYRLYISSYDLYSMLQLGLILMTHPWF